MKVTHLNTSDIGGAGIAARNLHLALLNDGVQSRFVTKYALGSKVQEHSILRPRQRRFAERLVARVGGFFGHNESAEHYYLQGRKKGFEHFSFPWSDLDPFSSEAVRIADILHLHWISDGFIDYQKIFRPGRKYVWTLHDMNPFTGGCHHSDGCMKFMSNCNYSFQLEGTRDEYLSGKILSYKLDALQKVNTNDLLIVTPSKWLDNLSRKSALFSRFRHEVIPNLHQLDQNPLNRNEAREKLGLKENQVALLFVSHQLQNPRKGIDLLMRAMRELNDPSIVLMGMGEKMQLPHGAPPIKQLGYISDPILLKSIYTAADAFLLPSLAENFPNTIVESLLSGTPVIASDVGGIPEQVTPENGLLVSLGDVSGWVSAVRFFVANPARFDRNSIAFRAKEKYDNSQIVKQYLDVYKSLLA